MKKHILGFAIFSLIISSAVFTKLFFYQPESFDVSAPAVNSSCWKLNRGFNKSEKINSAVYKSEAPIVKQALLNLNTKQMTWEVYVPETETPFALHLFVKDSDGARYLGTEAAPFVSSQWNKVIKYNSTYLWYYNLNSYDNVYVVPEMISTSDYDKKTFDPVFDESRATPVTLYFGKDE